MNSEDTHTHVQKHNYDNRSCDCGSDCMSADKKILPKYVTCFSQLKNGSAQGGRRLSNIFKVYQTDQQT